MGAFTSFEKAVEAFWSEWWITVAVMTSLILQLILLSTGTARKWSPVLRVLAWNAYNGSDYMATLALGGMVQNAIGSGNNIYSIWAPILLLHLGAPDNISAYTLEDNEFWLRHGFLMVLQILAAVFVVVNCAKGWHFIVLSTSLMLAGPIKYAERTLALRSASKSVIVESVIPIYRYMHLEHTMNLPIAGGLRPSTNSDPYFYIIIGEHQWYHHLKNHFATWSKQNNPDAYRRAAEMTSNLVTLEDILADPLLSSSPRILHTCLAFALFKLSRRRFSGLFIFEWQEPKTRRFFLQYSGDRPIFRNALPEIDIISVCDVELQFIFDSLYTKSTQTAFTRLGVLFRVSTTVFLILSAAMLRPMNTELIHQDLLVKQARMVTLLLVVAALFVEICQIIRLLRSDWTKVWLACTYIQLRHKQNIGNQSTLWKWAIKPCRSLIVMILKAQCRLVHEFKSWTKNIGQYGFIDQLIVTRSVKLAGWGHYSLYLGRIHSWMMLHNLLQTQQESDPDMLHRFRIQAVRDLLDLCHRLSVSVVDQPNFRDFYEFLTIEKLLAKRPWRQSFQQYCIYIAGNRQSTKGSETIIISWHLATTVCEMLDGVYGSGMDVDSIGRTVNMVKILSRYALYLLVKKAELLPCHADIGRQRAWDTQLSLCSTLANAYDYAVESCESSTVDLKLLMEILIMRSSDLRLRRTGDECEHLNYSKDTDVQRVLMNIHNLQCKYDIDHGQCASSYNIEEGESFSCSNVNNVTSYDNGLLIPEGLWPGLMAGKLLFLGIANREERWQFIWDVWIEIMAFLASPNNATEHLKQLAMGGEFLTYIWLLLGHIGFST